MYIYKSIEDGWYFDFGLKKVYFTIGERVLLKGETWVPAKILSITYNDDIDYITCDTGLEEEYIQEIPFQSVEDARV